MGAHAFVLLATNGEYDDAIVSPVAVYTDEAEADAECTRLLALVQQRDAEAEALAQAKIAKRPHGALGLGALERYRLQQQAEIAVAPKYEALAGRGLADYYEVSGPVPVVT